MEMAGPTSRTPPVGLRPRHGGGLPSPVAAPVTRAVVDYPSSDGKPMAESDAQRAAIIYAIRVDLVLGAAGVYVSGDLLIYYEEGNVSARIAPDAFVAFGVEKRERMTYLLWEERTVPEFAGSGVEGHVAGGRGHEARRAAGGERVLAYDPTDEYLTRKLLYSRCIYEEQTIPRAADGSLRPQRGAGAGTEGCAGRAATVPRPGHGQGPAQPQGGSRARRAGGSRAPNCGSPGSGAGGAHPRTRLSSSSDLAGAAHRGLRIRRACR